ncbi:TfuA-like protein [Marinomonas algicola]|uniref:TfuA-like protein n=1 Tax=Marinomonas algicola TaxID=2773454 RepID=UPI00174BFB6C|nr:TfuA-like protein [Marinomonas algicola]
MSIIVFAGPSIRQEQVLAFLPNADVRPPAKQGDLYLATRDKPQVILLIDGFFESVPAVWHKEILYAMSIGIHVYGSSSMGALRASELHTLGMVGVGRIFENYANGQWEDDDEVALTHGPKELGYMAVSRAMADLRYDLTRACEHTIITSSQARFLTSALKALWYPNRSQQALLQFAKNTSTENSLPATEGFSKAQVDRLSHFLQTDSRSLKTDDAIELLEKVSTLDLATLPAKNVAYALHENDAWQTLINDVASTRPTRIQVDLPAPLAPNPITETDFFAAKLRSRALEHADSIGVEFTPWIRPAFQKVAQQWGCLDDNGDVAFDRVSEKLLSLSLTTQQFDQWIEREATLLAYANQIEVKTEHVLDEGLIRQPG